MKNGKAKKLLLFVFIVIALCCTYLVLGCSTCLNGGDHKWDEKTDWSWIGGSSVHKDPTCTEAGYTDYSCLYCSEEKREIIAPLGHSAVIDQARVEPTCTTAGREEVSHCGRCKITMGTGKSLPKTPHTEQKIGEDIAPTCTSTGLLSEIRCADCGIVIRARGTLPMAAHTAVIDIPAIEPTCVKTGLTAKSHCGVCGAQISQQTVIPMASVHNFGDDNLKCIDCGAMNPDFKAIRNVQDLQNINLNLQDKYYLVNDIDLKNTNWEPIGRNYGVFTGVLDGNNLSVKNLSLSVRNNASKLNSIGGLFETNSGKIRNLTINNFAINISFIENAKNTMNDDFGIVKGIYGAFAGINNGTLESCTISGTVSMANERILEKYFDKVDIYEDHMDTSYSYFGGIAGVNSGKINNCINSSAFNCKTSGYVQSMFGAVGGVFYDKTYSVIFFGDIGGITGTNNLGGTISNCNVIGSFTFYSDLRVNCIKNTVLLITSTGYYCVMQNSMVVGSVVGTNKGNITGCKSIVMNISRKHTHEGVTNKTTINDRIISEGVSKFYGKNNGGAIAPIELIH